MRVPAFGWALLVGSALCNFVLLTRSASPAENRATAPPAVLEKSDVDGGGDHPLAHARTSIEAGRSAAECEKALPPLEAEVNALSIELRHRLPMPRLFALGESNPEMEQTFRPIVDRIFAAAFPADPDASARNVVPYTLECHDVVCELMIIASADAAPVAVVKAINSSVELRSRVTALSLPQWHSTEDLVTKAKVSEGRVYWRIPVPDGGPLQPYAFP
jgi:hypothetical protein